MKVKKRIVCLFLVLSFLLSFALSFTTNAEEEYTLSGSYQFDENIDLSGINIIESVNYTAFNLTDYPYTEIHIADDSIKMCSPAYEKYLYINSTWTSKTNRTIDFGNTPQTVSAAFYNFIKNTAKKINVVSSNVISDLSVDTSFDLNDYPADPTDMSVQLIQIAEGENGKLYVYVYQPADSVIDLKATYINMSTHHFEDYVQNFELYSLEFVDTYGTIDKYVVNGFKVSNDLYRYYNIATIYRSFNEVIDEDLTGPDDITSNKGFSVGKFIAAYEYNNVLKYEAKDIDVVDIDITSIGIIRYSEGYIFKQSYCDSHFVAFKINNFKVKDIFDATIRYSICDYSYSVGPGLDGSPNISNEHTETIDLTFEDKVEVDGGGILGYDYTWPRIQTYSEFCNMLSEHKNEKIVLDSGLFDGSEFVFSFLETDYNIISGTGVSSYFSQRVTDVTILRLRFATDAGVYNLGAVGDIVSDDGKPDVIVGIEDNIENIVDEYLSDVLGVILLIVIIVFILVVLVFLKPVFKMIYEGIVEIFSFIWSIITLPYQLIVELFNGKRK